MEFSFIWLGLALVVGIYAARRGRSGTGWFLLAVLVSPLIARLLCLALGPKTTADVPEAMPGPALTHTPNVQTAASWCCVTPASASTAAAS
jgi:hypothetical protein